MAITTYPQNYHDEFDSTKNYNKVLFIAGNGLQSRELNEIQDWNSFQLGKMMAKLLADGTIVANGSILAASSTNVSLDQAYIYAAGVVTFVSPASIAITGIGTEIIGMARQDLLFTDSIDPTIREDDPLSPNFGAVTSYREAMPSRWCLSSNVSVTETFFPMITIVNGVIQTTTNTSSSNATVFGDLINQYDNQVRGSALISGMSCTFLQLDTQGRPNIQISSGTARVQGVPTTTAVPTNVYLDAIIDTRACLAEPHAYQGVGNYPASFTTIQGITRVQGTVSTSSTLTHGSYTGALDTLPNTPVLVITNVSQAGTIYTQGVDYKLTSNTVDWSLNSPKQPAPGSTYQVTYQYIAVFTPATNPTLVPDSTATNIVLDGTEPFVNGSTIYIDYFYYLQRIDRISIDKTGNFIIAKGTPGYSVYSAPPYNRALLSLANVTLINGRSPVVTQDTILNKSVSDIQTMYNDLQDVKYNLGVLSLMQNAISTDPTLTKRNVFVDNLASYAQTDSGLANTALIVPSSGLNNVNTLNIAPVMTPSIVTTTNIFLPNLARSNPSTGNIVFQTTQFTTPVLINPYTTTNIQSGQVLLSPYWLSVGGTWAYWGNGLVNNQTPKPYPIGIQFAYFRAYEQVKITMFGGTYYVNTDGNGMAQTTITCPANTPVGSYFCVGTGQTSGIVGTQQFLVGDIASDGNYDAGITQWWGYADPLAQTFVFPYTFDLSEVFVWMGNAPPTNLTARISGTAYGVPDRTNVLGKGTIYPTNTAGSLNTNSGGQYPKGSTQGYDSFWTHVPLDYPVTIQANTVYAVTMMCNDNIGSLYTSQIGQQLITYTGGGYAPLGQYCYTHQSSGALLSSVNDDTWTTVAGGELCHKLIRAIYDISKPVSTVLGTATVVGCTDFKITGITKHPAGTSIRYYLQDAAGNQYDMVPDQMLHTSPISGIVTLYSVISSTSNIVTPIIFAGFTLLTGAVQGSAVYTSRQIPINNGVNVPANLKLIQWEYKPSGTTVTPQVQDASGAWQNMTATGATQIGYNWIESTYTYSNLASANTRLRNNIATSSTSLRPQVADIRMYIN